MNADFPVNFYGCFSPSWSVKRPGRWRFRPGRTRCNRRPLRPGRGLALFFLVSLLVVVGVLLAGAQDVLKEAVLPYLQSQPLALVAVILAGAAALLVLGEWVREKIVR